MYVHWMEAMARKQCGPQPRFVCIYFIRYLHSSQNKNTCVNMQIFAIKIAQL